MIRKEYMNMLTAENFFFEQKSRLDWIKWVIVLPIFFFFFYNLIWIRQAGDIINILRLLYDTISNYQNQIKEALLSYYSRLWGTEEEKLYINPIIFNKGAMLNEKKKKTKT